MGFLFFLACLAVTATSDLVLDLAETRLDQSLPPASRYLHTVRSALIACAFFLNCYAILVAKEVHLAAGNSKQTLRITFGLLVGLAAGFVLLAVLQYFDAKRGKEKFSFFATMAPIAQKERKQIL